MSPTKAEAELDETLARVTRRDNNGDNYVELSAADAPYPWFGIFLRGDLAAVHRFTSKDECYILVGDGSIPPAETIEFHDPMGPGTAVFTGETIVRTATAIRCVMAFAAGLDWPPDLAWELL